MPAGDVPRRLLLAAVQAACWDGTVVVWDVDSSYLGPGTPGGARPAELHRVGRRIADAAPLRAAVWVPRESAAVMGDAMDDGRNMIATGGNAGLIKFWDIRDNELLYMATGRLDWVFAVLAHGLCMPNAV